MNLLPKNIFKLFSIKPQYNINKAELKHKYFELCRTHHPDLNKNSEFIDIKDINFAYKILNNDLSRAHLLNDKVKGQDSKFLIKVLELEEEIESLSNLEEIKPVKDKIISKIEECKKHYNNPAYLSKWVYYERLLKMLQDKEVNIEILKLK